MSKEIKSVCPFCGKESGYEITDKQYNKIQKKYYGERKNIMDVVPEFNSFQREMLITGMCFNCQSKLYNTPIPGDNSWGDLIGDCECCGAPIWSVKNAKNGGYGCPSCHSKYTLVDGQLEELEE